MGEDLVEVQGSVNLFTDFGKGREYFG